MVSVDAVATMSSIEKKNKQSSDDLVKWELKEN
jgi:hypothetical protein